MADDRKQSSRQVYTADFKTYFLVAWSVWLFLMVGSFGYMWIKGVDLAGEWEQNSEIIILLTIGVALMSVLFPAVAWQRVEIDRMNRRVRIKNVLDRILSRTKEFLFDEIETMESKWKVRRGTILYIKLKGGATYRVNLTNLKEGDQLEKELDKIIQDAKAS